MYSSESFKKIIAWTLIASMVNPALIAPAFARDSDIYLTTPAGTSTAEPNVLFILGTNDRMNIAEAWREYDPVTYDSHAEYLWNDLAVINTAEVVAENVDMISTAAPPVNPFSAWGTWSGALNTDRRALWQATLAYAQGTRPATRGRAAFTATTGWAHGITGRLPARRRPIRCCRRYRSTAFSALYKPYPAYAAASLFRPPRPRITPAPMISAVPIDALRR